MKILVVSQYYYPEPFRITDICETLVKEGHEVTVLTGQPNYPEGSIYQGYKNHFSSEVINLVRVFRTKIKPRRTGSFNLMLNYFSFPFYARKIVKKLDKDYDIVFINQLSPILSALPGIKYARKNKVNTILYCLDLWPESLVAGGVKRKSIIYKIFGIISKKIYKKIDKILITSKSFKTKFDEYGINTEYFPQYSEDIYLSNINKSENSGDFNIVFAGNIGEIQSLETILLAAKELISFKDIKFNLYGSGSQFDKVVKLRDDWMLSNVIFHGRVNISEMPKIYSTADALLVTLKDDELLSMTLPGKVQSYMAAGKPIIGAINGETKEIIEDAKAGYIAKAEDYKKLADLIIIARNNPELYMLGLNGKKYYDENFNKTIFIEKLVKIMEELNNV